jgi:N-acetyl sugar amidotransferase
LFVSCRDNVAVVSPVGGDFSRRSARDKVEPNVRTLDRQLAKLPEQVRFCRRCVMSNQRPRIVFDDEGVCSACRFSDRKKHEIDWAARQDELARLLDRHRRKSGWDIIVAVSGGKDGSMVAHRLKHEHGMNPLTVTFAPFRYTPIGHQNYENFVLSGFDNLLFSPNGSLHRRLAYLAFEHLGDPFHPFGYGQMAYAFHMALKFGIELVFFGENGEAEYGGSTKNNDRAGMPVADWAELYFKGAPVDVLVNAGVEQGLYRPDEVEDAFRFYAPPPIEELAKAGIEMQWYSYYHHWIPQENYYYAREHTGFEANPDGRSEGTYSKYASLDDRLDGFHWWMAYVKFGIGRATYDAAHEIRDGHITREEAVALVKRFDGEFPKKYAAEVIDYMQIDEARFWEIADTYRHPRIWRKEGGEWVLNHAVWYE